MSALIALIYELDSDHNRTESQFEKNLTLEEDCSMLLQHYN